MAKQMTYLSKAYGRIISGVIFICTKKAPEASSTSSSHISSTTFMTWGRKDKLRPKMDKGSLSSLRIRSCCSTAQHIHTDSSHPAHILHIYSALSAEWLHIFPTASSLCRLKPALHFCSDYALQESQLQNNPCKNKNSLCKTKALVTT